MGGVRGTVRYLAALMVLVGLLAGSLTPATAEDGAAEGTTVEEGASTGEADPTGSAEGESSESGTQSEAVTIQAEDVSTVTFTVTVASPYLLDTLPAGSTWSITGTSDGGTPVDLGGTIDQAQTLPYNFTAPEQVPYGTYTLMFDATDMYEFVSRSIEVSSPDTPVAIELFPILESQVTLELSSADPTLADTMPEGAAWTISSTTGGGVVASGTFTGDQLQLPSSVALVDAIPYGEYLVTINATWAFEAYEQAHVIDSPIQTLDIVLTPYVEQPVFTTLSLVTDDGAEHDVSLSLTVTDAETLEVVVDESFDTTVPGPIWTGDLAPGDYWVTIDAGANYLGISEPFTVTARVPSEMFEFILIEIGPEPTVTPTTEPTVQPTAEPSVTPTAEPTKADKDKKAEVTTLPSTGQGSGPGAGGGLIALTFGGASLLLVAASVLWRQRRIGA